MKKKLSIFIVLPSLIAALVVTSCSSNFTPKTNYNDGPQRTVANSQLDQLFDEFKSHYESNLSADRKAEIKTVQENLVKYLIEASHSEDSEKIKIYNEATVYFNKMYPVLLENIRNEKKGQKTFTPIIKAPLWTLKDEIEFLNKEAEKFPSPKVSIDLLDGMKMVTPFYKDLSSEDKALAKTNYDKGAEKLLGTHVDLSPSFNEIENVIEFKGSDDEKILKIVNLVEEKLSKHEKSIRNIGSVIAKSGQVDMNNTQIRLVVRFMDYYFNKLPDDVIKTIMSELVTAGPKLTEEGVLNVVFQNTGPGLGKVLQQVGKEKGMGEKFSKLMAILESTGKPVPIHLVERVIAGDEGGFEVKSIVSKPLGTGTVAQVNKAVLIQDNIEKDVALRFLKPGVENRCKEDIAILRNFVPENEQLLKAEGVQDIKVMETLISSVEKFLNEETDLSIAVAHQKKANEVYSRSVKISADPKFHTLEMKVPEVYLPPHGKSNLHIQEFVTGGVKFADLEDKAAKKIVAEEMLRMWFEEALFRSGYLNADLHQGNFRIGLIEENNKIKIMLYDFGLSSTLSKEDQRAFILVGAGAHLKSSSTITDGLMASMNSTDKKIRKMLLKDIEEELKRSPDKRAEDWVAWCVKKNYFVSDKLGAFARGSLLLKQLPESIGESEMFMDVVIKSAAKNLAHSIADRDYNYPLTKMDMVKLGAVQVKNSCLNLIKSFLSLF